LALRFLRLWDVNGRESEERYVIAIIVAVITGVAVVGLGIAAAVTGLGDSDKHGRVEIPGRGTVELPEGDVFVYWRGASREGWHPGR
jgi:hypothetical protein